MAVGQSLAEPVDLRGGGPLVGDARRRVERNHVYLGPQSGEQAGEAAGVGHRVVDAPDQHVLERDPIPPLQGEGATRCEELGEWVAPIHGNERRPLLVGRAVQRDRQVRHDRFIRQPGERGDDANRRQRDPARRDSGAVRTGEDPQRAHRRIIVVQWLAHAHQDDVDRLFKQAQLRSQQAYLPDDFAGRQISLEPHLGG